MFKRLIIMLVLVGLVLGAIFGFKAFQSKMIKKYMGAMSKQPQTVSSTTAAKQEWVDKVAAVGTLRAVMGVDISTEVAGLIEGVYFESGEQVEAGTLLVKLRAEDEIAALASLKADAHLANLTYARDLRQLQEKSVAQATVDADAANLEKSRAAVEKQEAIIAKKFIRAPFTGRLGLREIDLGQYISPGIVIATLQSLDPIYFDFYVPQQDLAKIDLGQRVKVKTDLFPEKYFIGKIWAINSKVDTSTRNVLVRAVLDNHEQELLPGMYGVVEIDLGSKENYITLPQTAITYNPYGNTIFLVKENGTDPQGNPQLIAEQRFVTVGQTRGDQVAIISGIEEGEVVVTSGQMKLQNGTALIINNSVLPTDDINPNPEDK